MHTFWRNIVLWPVINCSLALKAMHTFVQFWTSKYAYSKYLSIICGFNDVHASVCVLCYSKTKLYKISSSGKQYKRKAKAAVRCPLCSETNQWISRHVRNVHGLSAEATKALLQQSDYYRRRGAAKLKPRRPCPISGCTTAVVHLGNHLRAVHKTTAFTVRHQKKMPSEETRYNNLTANAPTIVMTDDERSTDELIPPNAYKIITCTYRNMYSRSFSDSWSS